MSFSQGGQDFTSGTAPMSEINVTPMVDVMLVLLIIFMITAPLITHRIGIDLPQASATKNVEKPDIITLSISADGKMYWNDVPVSAAEWKTRLRVAALRQPQPELQLRADRTTQYQALAEIMADAQRAGLVKIGFITKPEQQKQ